MGSNESTTLVCSPALELLGVFSGPCGNLWNVDLKQIDCQIFHQQTWKRSTELQFKVCSQGQTHASSWMTWEGKFLKMRKERLTISATNCHLPLQGLNHMLVQLLIFNNLWKELGLSAEMRHSVLWEKLVGQVFRKIFSGANLMSPILVTPNI